MKRDVAVVVRDCGACARALANFGSVPKVLHPIPVQGLFYRWSCDLMGPLPRTSLGYEYVMIMVEHFSKYVDMVPITSKHAEITAGVFRSHVIGRFGSCAEVVTDRGGEWQEAFSALLLAMRIDHRKTSAEHPQSNGLAERAVQTTKQALRKLCAQNMKSDAWDVDLPFVMLGYNASVQSSSKFSPYHILHGVSPTVPPAVKDKFLSPVDLDDPALAARSVLERAALLERHCVEAGQNLLIAQHKDSLKYLKHRSGHYIPKVADFAVGDYVYVLHAVNCTLEHKARKIILRVLEVRKSGVLVLVGHWGVVAQRLQCIARDALTVICQTLMGRLILL